MTEVIRAARNRQVRIPEICDHNAVQSMKPGATTSRRLDHLAARAHVPDFAIFRPDPDVVTETRRRSVHVIALTLSRILDLPSPLWIK